MTWGEIGRDVMSWATLVSSLLILFLLATHSGTTIMEFFVFWIILLGIVGFVSLVFLVSEIDKKGNMMRGDTGIALWFLQLIIGLIMGLIGAVVVLHISLFLIASIAVFLLMGGVPVLTYMVTSKEREEKLELEAEERVKELEGEALG